MKKYFAIAPAAVLALFAVAETASASNLTCPTKPAASGFGSGTVVDSGTIATGEELRGTTYYEENKGGQGFLKTPVYEEVQDFIECEYEKTNKAGNVSFEYESLYGDPRQGDLLYIEEEKVCGNGSGYSACTGSWPGY